MVEESRKGQMWNMPVFCGQELPAQSHDGKKAGRCILMGERDSGSQAQPWPHKWADSPRNIDGTQPITSWGSLPVWFVHCLQRLFLFPQECPEGWDSSDLIRGLRQKKQSKVWMARSPAVLRNRLLWSLPTTPARSPARPCSPSSTSPLTGATLAHFTTRLRGSGRCTHRGKSPTTQVQSWARAREALGPEGCGWVRTSAPWNHCGTLPLNLSFHCCKMWWLSQDALLSPLAN